MEIVNLEEQYRKFPEVKKEEVLKLWEWVNTQPHLPKLTELEIFFYYHSCCCTMEFAKRTIDTAFTLRTHCPDLFSNLDVKSPEVAKATKTIGIAPLKERTPEGYRVFFSKLIDSDPSNFNFSECLKLYFLYFDQCLYTEGTADGTIFAIDMKGITLGHLPRIGPMLMRKFLYYLQNGLPVKIKGIHYVNIVPFMDKILALVKPFLKKELLDVLVVHSSMDTFYKYVPQDILPVEYGGNKGSLPELIQKNSDNALKNREWFLEYEKKLVNEKLRPGKPKQASDIFGAEGNFKKLDFD